MIFDLHTHTYLSHDGFTKPEELLLACKIRGINAIAITEHDKICEINTETFTDNGIEVIPGCEYTDEFGAHIIGLFVTKKLPYGSKTETIIEHIHSEGGFVVMPHPWKPGSGFMALGGDHNLISQFDFIELINGGWSSEQHFENIIELATSYKIRLISASDSHKACQVGLCCTRITHVPHIYGAYAILKNSTQDSIELLVDRHVLGKMGRRINLMQRMNIYQKILPIVPKSVRRQLKVILYNNSKERLAHKPNFEKVSLESLPW